MAIYHVEILETLRKVVKVEADSAQEAFETANDEYCLGTDPKYILGSDDYLETEITVVDPDNDFAPLNY